MILTSINPFSIIFNEYFKRFTISFISTYLTITTWNTISNGYINRNIEEKMNLNEKIKKKLKKTAIIEVCCDTIASVSASSAAGATSIELCCSRGEGGVTPSFGFVQEAVHKLRNTNTEIHVCLYH